MNFWSSRARRGGVATRRESGLAAGLLLLLPFLGPIGARAHPPLDDVGQAVTLDSHVDRYLLQTGTDAQERAWLLREIVVGPAVFHEGLLQSMAWGRRAALHFELYLALYAVHSQAALVRTALGGVLFHDLWNPTEAARIFEGLARRGELPHLRRLATEAHRAASVGGVGTATVPYVVPISLAAPATEDEADEQRRQRAAVFAARAQKAYSERRYAEAVAAARSSVAIDPTNEDANRLAAAAACPLRDIDTLSWAVPHIKERGLLRSLARICEENGVQLPGGK